MLRSELEDTKAEGYQKAVLQSLPVGTVDCFGRNRKCGNDFILAYSWHEEDTEGSCLKPELLHKVVVGFGLFELDRLLVETSEL